MAMASKESAAAKELYQSWTAARQRGERGDIERTCTWSTIARELSFTGVCCLPGLLSAVGHRVR
jgi:hypothetical protein